MYLRCAVHADAKENMFTKILLHAFFIWQIEAINKLSDHILRDRDVNLVLFGQQSSDHKTRLEIICNIINCFLACEFWLLFLFIDVTELYVSTQLFMLCRFSEKLHRAELAVAVFSALLWFMVRSPHCVNLVYYQIFTTPVTAYHVVETHVKENIRVKYLDLHYYCWVVFWGFSLFSFISNVHWADVGLLPVTFYMDVVIWEKHFQLLSRA